MYCNGIIFEEGVNALNSVKSDYLMINNGNLFYSIKGDGEPLILIHGNFNDSRIWEYQMDYLSNYYKVISYDQRGYGKSSTPEFAFSPHDDLKELFDRFAIKKAIIMGSSSGGSVAIDFVLKFPELVKGLILVAPSINGYRYPMKVMFEAMKNIFCLNSKGFEVAVEKFINNSFWSYFFPPEHRPEAREKVLMTVRTQKNFYSWNFKLATPQKPYASERLKEIPVPSLIILSDRDKAFNIKTS